MPAYHAIVLRRRDSGESDRRLTILTAETGKLDVIAKGARKSGSRLAGVSDPLCVSTLDIADGKVNRFITQAQPLRSFPGLRSDYERLGFALALTELYAAILPYEQPVPEAHALLFASLSHLETHPKPIVALVWCEVQLLLTSGFMPQLERCVVTDQPIQEAEPFLSPTAGGYVSYEAALRFGDRYLSRAEVLYGLTKIAELAKPPANLRYAEQTLADLFPFWREIAATPLPANETAVREARHG